MSLLEHEATRMAAALGDYEHVGVTDIGGTDQSGFWIDVTDERFGLDYEIDSHADYWDFLGYFCSGKAWPVKALFAPCVSPGVASNGPGSAAALVDAAPGAVSLKGMS